jgi:hypothetical protein
MKSNVDLGRHEDSGPDMPEPITPSGHQRDVREKALDELSRLVIIFGYLWVVFELLPVNKSIVLSEYHLNYPEHAFAIINSMVFAKVLLTQNCMWDFIVKLSRHVCAKLHFGLRPTSLWALDRRIRSLAMRRVSPGSSLIDPGDPVEADLA